MIDFVEIWQKYSKRLWNRVCMFQFSCRFAFLINFSRNDKLIQKTRRTNSVDLTGGFHGTVLSNNLRMVLLAGASPYKSRHEHRGNLTLHRRKLHLHQQNSLIPATKGNSLQVWNTFTPDTTGNNRQAWHSFTMQYSTHVIDSSLYVRSKNINSPQRQKNEVAS